MDLDPLPPPEGLPIGLDALGRRTFEAVLFDMDGTLIDSTPVVTRSWIRWARDEGVDPTRLAGLHGVPAVSVVDQVMAERDRASRAAALERITAIEVADVEGIVVLPGAEEALAALAGEAPRSAIATSCTLPLATARIAATGLVAPDVVVTADEVERGKPDPAPYLLAAARVGADPARCLVVEDAPAGIAAGRAAGCAVLAVAVTHTVDALREAGPDAVVRDLAAVRLVAGDDGVVVRPAQEEP